MSLINLAWNLYGDNMDSFPPNNSSLPYPGVVSRAKIQLSALNYLIHGKQIFDDAEFSLVADQRATIVGENGIGKSTFLRIISGEDIGYDGKVSIEGTIGYLPQSLENLENRSVLAHIIHHTKKGEWQELADNMYSMPFEAWIQEFSSQGGYLIFEALHRMKLTPEILRQDLFTLSGGEKTKIHLCALFQQDPDILLLDEPTNHLDLDGIRWLETSLNCFKGGVVMVTHDRTLIEKTSTMISELSSTTHKFTHFRGSYQSYLNEKKKIIEKARAERSQQENEIKQIRSQLKKAQSIGSVSSSKKREDNEKLGYNARGQRQQKGHGRLTGQLHGKLETLHENLVQVPVQRKKLDISLSEGVNQGALELDVENLTKTLGHKTLFKKISFSLRDGDRLILKGPNGAGKTTLLKLLTQFIAPDEGCIRWSPNATIGFLDQEQELTDLKLNAIELVKNASPMIMPSQLMQLLKRFDLYHRYDVESPLSKLSIGSRRKAQLASIVASGANVLLLDEPTNHLDITSLEKIEDELLRFPGIIVAVTHDRYFTEKIATQILDLQHYKGVQKNAD